MGLGLVNYFEWRGTPSERESNRRNYERAMVSLVEWLLAEGYSVRLLTGDVWDDPYVQRLLTTIQRRQNGIGPDRLVGEPAADLHTLMGQLSEVEVVVAARYHNVVAALRLAKPVLALSYAPKASQVMEQFGMLRFSHPLGEIDPTRLKAQFEELYGHRHEIGRALRTRVAIVESQLQAQGSRFVTDYLLP